MGKHIELVKELIHSNEKNLNSIQLRSLQISEKGKNFQADK